MADHGSVASVSAAALSSAVLVVFTSYPLMRPRRASAMPAEASLRRIVHGPMAHVTTRYTALRRLHGAVGNIQCCMVSAYPHRINACNVKTSFGFH